MKDITGKVFGRLSVIREAGRSEKQLVLWECKCECGNTITIKGTYLIKGTQSCGCIVKDRLRLQGTHNNCKRGKESPTWVSWKSMLDRVKPTHKSHAYYYDKGVKVCPQWQDFSVFLHDMGNRPDDTTLDRIDTSLGYEPANCRWATKKEQANNRGCMKLYEYDGDAKTLTEWSEDPRCLPTKQSLYARVLKYNVPIDKALTTPHKGKLK
jgi:hypothetical protein